MRPHLPWRSEYVLLALAVIYVGLSVQQALMDRHVSPAALGMALCGLLYTLVGLWWIWRHGKR